MDSRCLATNTAGEPCQAQPVRPSGYCYWHDPTIADERDRKRREGGAHRSNKARARKALPGAPLTPEEVQGWLGVVFRDLIDGTIEPGVATACANLARAMTTVREHHEVVERLTALEEAAASARRA